MSWRRWGVRVAAAVAAVLVIGATGVLLLRPVRGPLVEHRYPAGGFTLSLPSSWHVHLRDSGERPWNWIEADRPTRLGPSDAWLWLNRTQPDGHDPLATARRNALDDIRRRWGAVRVSTTHTSFEGRAALTLRLSRPVAEHLGLVPGSDVEEVRLITEHAGQVYELGVVGWPHLPREADDLERLLHLSTPTGLRTIDDASIGLRITMPADWNRFQTPRPDMPDGVLSAADPSYVHDGWTTIWRYDDSVESAIEKSAAKAARDGTIVRRSRTTIGGHPATRIEFRTRAPDTDRIYTSVTWIFEGPDGKTWQLLVGSALDDTANAARIAASIRFPDSR